MKIAAHSAGWSRGAGISAPLPDFANRKGADGLHDDVRFRAAMPAR